MMFLVATSDLGPAIVAAIAAVLGAGLGAAGAGIVQAWTARTDRKNQWLEYKRGLSNGVLQHQAVHCRAAEPEPDDRRLIAQYYQLVLAVTDEAAAVGLYRSLPESIRARVHDPEKEPLRDLRREVLPERGKYGKPGPSQAE